MDYKYDNFVKHLSAKIDSALGEISAEYNFDLGDEFEVTIAKLLKMFLPGRYGICRGFIVDSQGNKVGDDIIIYDHLNFPHLRIGLDENFQQKQKIPVEAVYAYIEVKNSLELNHTNFEKSTFGKAISQCKNAKKLLSNRTKVPYGAIDPYLISNLPTSPKQYFPRYKNPPFAAIIAKELKLSGKTIEDETIISFAYNTLKINDEDKCMPDIIIAGKSHIILWHTQWNETNYFINYLLEHKSCEAYLQKYDEIALGAGFLNILAALGWMKLGILPWEELLDNTYKQK